MEKSLVDLALPAGDESDCSDDEWDIGCVSERKTSGIKNLEDHVLHGDDCVTMLKNAISNGDSVAVEQLLNSGMDVETRLGFGWTPLMYAVSVANYDLAKLLLDKGASANFSKDHWTVLMASCTASASEDKMARCVELLLSRNVDPNVAERSQMTCLMLAARDGYSKIINLLASHGAKINSQNKMGYTALSIAVQYGREEAVLKLLQLGADKTIRTKSNKSPADLAVMFNHTTIAHILASSSHIPAAQAFTSMEESLSKFFKTNSEFPSSKESATKLDELHLLLHGLDLGYLTNILSENDVTWNDLLTMEEDDFKKIGITDPEDQQKLMRAVQQMHMDKVDLNSISTLGTGELGTEDLQNFLISVSQQCCYLTETVQDVVSRFPRHTSQLVFSLDPKKEAQSVCNQLIVETKDLQKEIICLRSLLCQMDEARDCYRLPQASSSQSWSSWFVTGAAVSVLGATVLFLFCRTAGGEVYLC
ncbi:ankyrin repeat, SAM and basic leucine zipper domain-containing protein 1 [Austrofundulus limnaeus]|uniref:Ankyrin repeat, SAM and basic leucine zipper domain-containing protein 1 n=1 Tax=Austrofundulus limnaeus TaxID=52670 RepID=A0A2I4BDA2_AUSLI|nr:PREDICTED: ankyrin repeat, SAM and basic leucine zipper domain-containing protein 1 [Austrofundulus limnaeus]